MDVENITPLHTIPAWMNVFLSENSPLSLRPRQNPISLFSPRNYLKPAVVTSKRITFSKSSNFKVYLGKKIKGL